MIKGKSIIVGDFEADGVEFKSSMLIEFASREDLRKAIEDQTIQFIFFGREPFSNQKEFDCSKCLESGYCGAIDSVSKCDSYVPDLNKI